MLGGIFRWFWGGSRRSDLEPLPQNVIVGTQRLSWVRRRVRTVQTSRALTCAQPRFTVRFDG